MGGVSIGTPVVGSSANPYTLDTIFLRMLREFSTVDMQFFFDDCRDVLSDIMRVKGGRWGFLIAQPYSFDCTQSDEYFTLPGDFNILLGVYNKTRQLKMREWTTTRFLEESKIRVGTSDQSVIRYMIVGDGAGERKIRLLYPPHEISTIEVYYYRRINMPTSPTDVIDLPDMLQSVFVLGLRSHYCALWQDNSAAEKWKQIDLQYQAKLRDAKFQDSNTTVPYLRNLRTQIP